MLDFLSGKQQAARISCKWKFWKREAPSVKGKKWCQPTPSTMVDRRTLSAPFETFCPLQRLLQNPYKIPAQTQLFQKQLNHFRAASKYLNNPS